MVVQNWLSKIIGIILSSDSAYFENDSRHELHLFSCWRLPYYEMCSNYLDVLADMLFKVFKESCLEAQFYCERAATNITSILAAV